jgi:selenocysteine lyase/cysteine desulfurase
MRSNWAATRGYLSACTLGLPTLATRDALADDLARWAEGRVSTREYTALIERVRADYARLVNLGPDRIAIGSQASGFAGMVATGVPDGGEVLCVDGDFTSIVFPFLTQHARGIRVRHVPLAALADEIRPSTDLVAFSLVQSATGDVADAGRIVEAARAAGTRTLCDTTQAVGWLPVDASAFDATICHAYKWLCSPRGAAFLSVDSNFADHLVPHTAGWYAGDDPWASCYGPQMRLAADARRFDLSPAWSAWVGAEPAIRMFADADGESIRSHAVGLADAFAERIGWDRRGSAIVSWPDPDGDDLARLLAAGFIASGRAGRARVAFHLWNDDADVAEAAHALGR